MTHPYKTKQDNIAMLDDTLSILNKGYYRVGDKKVTLKLSRAQMEEAHVYLPLDVLEISEKTNFKHEHFPGRCAYGCENMDSFKMARKRMDQFSNQMSQEGTKSVLVLNLANPVNKGGGVLKGSKVMNDTNYV